MPRPYNSSRKYCILIRIKGRIEPITIQEILKSTLANIEFLEIKEVKPN